MKHTKGRFSIRKHPFIITFIIMAVIAVVVAVGYIDVNHRFPEPEEEIVREGNAFYEIDDECMRKKEEQKKKKEFQPKDSTSSKKEH